MIGFLSWDLFEVETLVMSFTTAKGLFFPGYRT